MKRSNAYLAITLLLTGCSVGPNFKTPDAPSTTAYTTKNETLLLKQRIALGKDIETEWWALFSSDAVNKLVRQAVDNNYDLISARETLAQAKAMVQAESGTLAPQVSLGAVAGAQKYGAALFGPANFSIPPFNYYEVGPSASWTPDLFGGAHRAIERQQALADYQTHEVDALYVALTGDTVAAAVDLAAANAETDVLARLLAEDQASLRLELSSYAAGAATRQEILTAQNRLISDQALSPALEQRLSVSRHALALFVGRTPADWTPPDLDLSNFALPQPLPVSLPSELAKRRPDILAAAANVHAASAAVGIATANLYPQITLSANMMQEALTPVGLFSAANNAWALAAGLTVPIFNGGTLTAEKRSAEHAYRASLAQYRQTVLIAFRQVADALTALAHDDQAATNMQNAFDTDRAALDIAHGAQRAGAIGLLQLEDAERAVTLAELDMIRAQHQRTLDCVRLFVALGGSPVADKPL